MRQTTNYLHAFRVTNPGGGSAVVDIGPKPLPLGRSNHPCRRTDSMDYKNRGNCTTHSVT